MASIDKRPDGRWRARWREYANGPQRSKHFDRKVDAEQWLVKVQHDLFTGAYIDPSASRVTLSDYYATWLARMKPTWRAGTVAAVRNSFEKHMLPALGGRPLSSIKRADVERLCASLPLAASTIATVHQHLGQLLGGAVEDGLIVRNPANKARRPRRDGAKAQPVPLELVERIGGYLPEWMAVAVPLGVGVGLRQAEASGLTVDRVDFLRRTVRIDRQLLSRYVPEPVLAPPKTASSHRTVPLASFVLEALAGHLSRSPASSSDLVLRDPKGNPLDDGRFMHYWRRACVSAGADGVRYHDLRHTFASTLLSRGVSVKAVADWLGHATPNTTLATYAHLMPSDEEVARSVLDGAFVGPAEDLLRTEPQV